MSLLKITTLLLVTAWTQSSAFATITKAQAVDLVQKFNSNGKTVVFVFCREDRDYHCLSILRDAGGRMVQNATLTGLWTLPMLADSDGDRDYNEAKGNTPQGIYSMDGVMPFADRNLDYGDYRRIVMNFLPSQDNDQATIDTLPESLQKLSWWKEASIARHLGRGQFRIHGVGFLNQNPTANNYPFIPTWGCLTTREGTYDGVHYQDQRVLLDSLMRAQGLEVSFDHETQIKGYVVVVNLNAAESHVKAEDLSFLK
jgi:hypothetical protein